MSLFQNPVSFEKGSWRKLPNPYTVNKQLNSNAGFRGGIAIGFAKVAARDRRGAFKAAGHLVEFLCFAALVKAQQEFQSVEGHFLAGTGFAAFF